MSKVNPSRERSRQLKLKRYNGMLCAMHPEINGERNTKNGTCISCNRENMAIRRAADPARFQESSRKSYFKNRDVFLRRSRDRNRLKNTGFTRELFDSMLAFQKNKCGICDRKIFGGRETHSDHCHEANIPRGLLCSQCNQAEGMIAKSGISAQEWIKRLMEYLNNPPVQRMKLQ